MPNPARPDDPPLLNVPRQRVRIVATMAIMVLAGLFGWYGVADRRTIMDEGVEAAEQMASQTALIAAGTLEAGEQLLHAMELLVKPPVADGRPDPDAVRAALLDLRAAAPHLMDLLILSGDGRIVHWTGSGTPPPVAEREYFTAHLEGDSRLYVGPPQLSKVHAGRWFFALSEALRDPAGALTNVLVVIIDVGLLRERLTLRNPRTGISQALLTEDARVYSRTPDHERHVGKQLPLSAERAGLSADQPYASTVTVSPLDGQERIVAYQHLRRYPMVAAATLPVAELLAPWRKRMTIACLLWLALSAAIVAIALRAAAISRIQQEQASLDGLTGVYNRRSIMAHADEFARALDRRGELSMLMIDIDHFKEINDTYGHLAGDDAIRRISQLLRDEVRGSDIVGRYGGEEFLVLMPDTGTEGATHVAEKLRAAVAAQVTTPTMVTISVGVATSARGERSLEPTLARADAALYAAKQAGRNCVRVAEPASEPAGAAG
ncbi:sensor domain-containing diguanylate cyclase [Aromatoleum evansii]|uniref:diguanylate cyclase n=1 Tax=Aromatoleum evansii TaxID=59406 RepID=A0ABZ1AQC1_AROEV|nr:sensor domain-containing diguanylate cyclase [Aromatoleum evansii]